MGDAPRSEEILPKANPNTLEPAGPSSPASVTVTVGDEGADTPVGPTPIIGDEPENVIEGDSDLHGGRILLGERLERENLGVRWNSHWLPIFLPCLLPACLFQAMPQSHSLLLPAKGVLVPVEPRCQ